VVFPAVDDSEARFNLHIVLFLSGYSGLDRANEFPGKLLELKKIRRGKTRSGFNTKRLFLPVIPQ